MVSFVLKGSRERSDVPVVEEHGLVETVWEFALSPKPD